MTPTTVQKKVMGMYTDPKRLRVTDPGTVENNPLWIFHETFNPDQAWVAEQEEAYRQGKVGDVVIKRKLVEVLNTMIEPIRARRKQYESRADDVLDVLRAGTRRANAVAEETLAAGETEDEAGLFHAETCHRLILADRAGELHGSLYAIWQWPAFLPSAKFAKTGLKLDF